MWVRGLVLAMAASLLVSRTAQAQAVEVTSLAAPDYFSIGAGDTGLGPELWSGAAADTLQTVLPLLASRSLSPAAQGLARRVLSTPAIAPGRSGQDPMLAGQRISGLINQGGLKAASLILGKTTGLESSPALAQAAAEVALLSDQAERACDLATQLAVGREAIYWLRLRAYCQVKAGQVDAAQLTFDLAQGQARDAIFGRLMTAKLSGSGDPGPAALRNGLDFALSRNLGLPLDLSRAAPAVAVALAGEAPATGPAIDPAFQAAWDSVSSGARADAQIDALFQTVGNPATQARARSAGAILMALHPVSDPAVAARLARADLGAVAMPAGRLLALDQAARRKSIGQVALLVLWSSADAGPAGLGLGDRLLSISALKAVGLDQDAATFAAEGLAGLK